MQEVHVPPADPVRLEPQLGAERHLRFIEEAGPRARDLLGTRAIVHVNSTAAGGGVAEMLEVLLAYARGVGVDARWFVMDGTPEFFAITKRIHNRLHGADGDGGPLGDEEHGIMRQVADLNVGALTSHLRAGDVVVLHDPQTIGLAAHLEERGHPLVWRCHVGIDHENGRSREAWTFIRRFLEPHVDRYVFTRPDYAPDWIPSERLTIIPPSVDPASPKNHDLDDETVHRVLVDAGIIAGPTGPPATFQRRDGSRSRVQRGCDIIRAGAPPEPDVPLVVQVSRWDHLKDMQGVMEAFAAEAMVDHGAHLVLAGPAVAAVTDDPEGLMVLQECWDRWRELPDAARARITLACVPMTDPEENAIIINALQRHARVVVQKSLAEGFGLTVTEAMLKGTPVIASRVGGIADQIDDGVEGCLLDDPSDLTHFAAVLDGLLAEPDRIDAMGAAARERAVSQFVSDVHLRRWLDLLIELLEPEGAE